MPQPALVLTEVGKSYRLGPLEIEVLRGVNLRVETGERLTIQGRTGSGKTTLLNILGLLDTPSRGSYLLAGRDTHGADDETRSDLRNSHLGFVFQAYHLIPYLSAVENVALPLEYRNDAPGSAERRAREVLDRVGLSDRAWHRPDELSGGERQRVAVARAVVGRPSLLLADEPTAALDADSRDELLDLLVTLNREDGLTLVLMTHDDAVAARGTRRVRLHEGALLEAPAP